MAVNLNKKSNPEKLRGLFFQIGLAVALLLTFGAFEWETSYVYDREPPVSFDEPDIYFEEIIPIKIIKKAQLPPPPKPIKKVSTINVVPDPVVIIYPLPTPDPEPVIVMVTPKPEPHYKEEPVPPSFGAEVMPSFPGGNEAMLRYIKENIVYPSLARKEGISGLVYLQITVNENGRVSEVVVLRGIGAGCDKEAVRVVTGMPMWNPGKQAGHAVPVIMTIPINYILL
jgi:periplasmic protein TonB